MYISCRLLEIGHGIPPEFNNTSSQWAILLPIMVWIMSPPKYILQS